MDSITTNIPRRIWDTFYQRNFTSSEMLITLAILTYCRSIVGIFTLNTKVIASICCVSKRTVDDAIKKLEEKGYLVRDNTTGEVLFFDVIDANGFSNGGTIKVYLHDLECIESEFLIQQLYNKYEKKMSRSFLAALRASKWGIKTDRYTDEELNDTLIKNKQLHFLIRSYC